MKFINHKQLGFYKAIQKLIRIVYKLSKQFPQEEHGYTGLVNQIRRAVVSALSNIAEGSSRQNKELLHFFAQSLGSLREVEAQLEIARDLEYITKEEYENAKKILDKGIGGLYNYMKSLNKTINN